MAYEYTPLNESLCEIRLLTLLPGEPDDALQGTLENHSLAPNAHPPLFEALSYFWGNPPAILIDAHPLPIADNLNIALHHLRLRNAKRLLWIDAICINQQDIPERNWQVLAMDAVYSRADLVVVWLGPADAQTDAAMDLMGAVAAETLLDPVALESAEAQAYPEACPSDCYIDIECLLDRPWWRRLWIV
ncbi:hypothetical protein SCUCBS95973_009342 [Sporothrix curviconia]|uniref:Heterokaryon incompatibility domain-containing protein n=1 Tax=Sporothrix curviconia TaxID=1260050 RepID=A0ABP0CU74_9PEZI